MTEDSPLSEDLARWPADPYALLGVNRTAGERDLRRAYVRLIRTWKPEQFPEHFQRIRSAYETLLRFLSFFVEAVPRDIAEAASTGPISQALDEVEEVWRLALEGQEETAYRRYVEFAERRPGRADVVIRLYWLLAVDPQLDPNKTAFDWLVQGLVSNGAEGPLRALYLRELSDNPAEATTPRADRILELPMSAARLADIADAHIAALVKLAAWDLIEKNMDRLADRIARDDEQAWLRLVGNIAAQVAWVNEEGAAIVLGHCRNEFERLQHLAIHTPHDFDRFEALLEAAERWDEVELNSIEAEAEDRIPEELLRLIPRLWTESFAEVRPQLEETLACVAGNPLTWLKHFTTAAATAPAALAQFGRSLDTLQHFRECYPTPLPAEELGELARDFFAAGPSAFNVLRGRFLAFCIEEAVPPEHLIEHVRANRTSYLAGQVQFCENVSDDWPLRYIYRACAQFAAT